MKLHALLSAFVRFSSDEQSEMCDAFVRRTGIICNLAQLLSLNLIQSERTEQCKPECHRLSDKIAHKCNIETALKQAPHVALS